MELFDKLKNYDSNKLFKLSNFVTSEMASIFNGVTIVNFCEVIHVRLIDSLKEGLPSLQEWKQLSMELILLFLPRTPNLVFENIILSNTFV